MCFVQYLADVENRLGETITTVDKSMDVPVNEFDGNVVYGEKRGTSGKRKKQALFLDDEAVSLT